MRTEAEITAQVVKLRQRIDRCQYFLDNPSAVQREKMPGPYRIYYSQIKRDAMLQLEQLLWLFGRDKETDKDYETL